MTALDVIGALVLFPLLAALAVIDGATLRLPDRLTLPLIAGGLVWSGAVHAGWPWNAILGAALGYGVFALIGWAFIRTRGVDGLGLGDAKLLAAGGAWTGATLLPWIVLLAALGALAATMVRGSGPDGRIAFGPWLALAIGLCWSLRVIW